MFLRILITIILGLTGICLQAQTNIDFFPKMLRNDLLQSNGTVPLYHEIIFPAEISNEIYLGKFYEISGSSGGFKFIYVGRVKTYRAGGCSINRNLASEGESEFFDYYILFDSAYTIQQIKVYNYQATHGQEVTSKNWLKQFKGFNGSKELIVNKNVDAISGATISVHAITIDIDHKTRLIKNATDSSL